MAGTTPGLLRDSRPEHQIPRGVAQQPQRQRTAPVGADHPTTSTPDGRPGMRPKGAVCMIKITTDSTCDLPRELLERYNITVTPLGIIKAGKLYQDRGGHPHRGHRRPCGRRRRDHHHQRRQCGGL